MKRVVLLMIVMMCLLSGCVKETDVTPSETAEVIEQFFCIDNPDNEFEYVASIGQKGYEHEIYFTPSNIITGTSVSNIHYGNIKYVIQEGVELSVSRSGATFYIHNTPVYASDTYSVTQLKPIEFADNIQAEQ